MRFNFELSNYETELLTDCLTEFLQKAINYKKDAIEKNKKDLEIYYSGLIRDTQEMISKVLRDENEN